MRVGVDARSLRRPGAARGVARYLEHLLDELRRLFPEDEYAPATHPGRVPYAAGALCGRPRLDRAAGGCQVLWAPAPAPLAISRGLPLVLTVHDLSFEHRPADFTAYERLWHRVARPRSLARRAARVITVSEPVRTELVREWQLAPERVACVPSGPGLVSAAGADAGVAPGFLLAVGALEPRKRPDLLADAYARARQAGLSAELVVAGEGRERGVLEAVGARMLGRVSDERLAALYGSALALVCSSREEGFGFTPLEAAARGTASLVPDLPVFGDTLGDAALRFAPGDAGSLADVLLRIEREPGLAERLGAEAARAAGALSWERAARATRALLAEAAAEGSA